ncbi:MAG: glutamate--tRNA ligase [Bauldia sp.]|nr:glutamate--tRNA ligase [Bauldia sp.]
MPDVVTRFAPSPTGFLHIGGARTALFNWLYTRHVGGRMLLRIEDTDRERSTDAAVAAILDGLRWLGIDWDGEPVFQFARADRHREVAEELVARGQAYRCYATPAELQEMKERARAEKRPERYDGRWRDRDPSEAPAGVNPVIRVKAPQDGETVIDDAVQGRVVVQNKELDDFVILRSDGTPTYMLSVVVDDQDMGVTQIIRGDDHLNNGFRQRVIIDAMGWTAPGYAHIPLIHGPDGAKLSKRHGAVGVDAYRAKGYLAKAMRNYIVRLGWAHGDAEIMTEAEMVAWFDLDGIGRSAARFDFAKLENLNGHYIRNTPDDELFATFLDTLPHLPGGPEFRAALTPEREAQFRRALPAIKERAKTLIELMDGGAFLTVTRPLAIEPAAAALLDDAGRATLAGVIAPLSAADTWNEASTEAVVRAYAEASGLKLGKVAQPIRAAVTGRTTSPPIFDVLAILGREEALGRIRDQAGAP